MSDWNLNIISRLLPVVVAVSVKISLIATYVQSDEITNIFFTIQNLINVIYHDMLDTENDNKCCRINWEIIDTRVL